MVPLDRVAGGADVLARLDWFTLRRFAMSPLGRLQLGMPRDADQTIVAELLKDSFQTTLRRTKLKGSLGPVALIGNSFIDFDQFGKINADVEARLGKSLSKPSLKKPAGDGSIAIMARASPGMMPGPGKLCAYVELSMMATDGRLPEAVDPANRGETKPYIANLCVTKECQRNGLGFAMVRLAEDIVARTWKEDAMYLHLDDEYTGARALYDSMDYAVLDSPNCVPGVTHMYKPIES